MSIISCTIGLLRTLYLGKDNAILLSYPAHHIEVFLSKLLVFYIYEAVKGVFFLLPLLLGFGIIYKSISVLYLLFINRFLNRFVAIKGGLLIGLLGGLFYVVYKVMELIPVPLRIIALYNSFILKINSFINSVNQYSLFYKNIGEMITLNNFGINLLVLLGVILVLILLVAALAMPLYFSLASKSSEHANVKKHKGGNKAHKNTFFTFVKKEWLLCSLQKWKTVKRRLRGFA